MGRIFKIRVFKENSVVLNNFIIKNTIIFFPRQLITVISHIFLILDFILAEHNFGCLKFSLNIWFPPFGMYIVLDTSI